MIGRPSSHISSATRRSSHAGYVPPRGRRLWSSLLLSAALSVLIASTGVIFGPAAPAFAVTLSVPGSPPITYTENAAAADLTPSNDILVTGIGAANTTTGSVIVSPCNAGDRLAATSTGNVTVGAYVVATCTLPITATAGGGSNGNWTTVLNSVTFDVTAPNADAPVAGTRTITFTINETGGAPAIASGTRDVSVIAVNDGPTHLFDGVSTITGGLPDGFINADRTTTEDVARVFSSGLGNPITVTDPDAGNSNVETTLTASSAAAKITVVPAGSVTVSGNGTNNVTILGTVVDVNQTLNGVQVLPAPNFVGTFQLTVKTDDKGNTGAGGFLVDLDTFDIIVTGGGQDPIPQNQPTVQTFEDVPVSIVLTWTDADTPGASFTAGSVGWPPTTSPGSTGTLTPAAGTLLPACFTDPGTGVTTCFVTITYTPPPNFFGSASFTWGVDDDGSSAGGPTQNVAIFVQEINDPPVANDDGCSTTVNTAVSSGGGGCPHLLANDSDPDSAAIIVASNTGPLHGNVTITSNTTGAYTYTPVAGYTGPDSFTYQVQDADGALSNFATVTINVNPPSGGGATPVAQAKSVTTAEDTPVVITLSGTDADSLSLSFTTSGGVAGGTIGTISTPVCVPGIPNSCTATVTFTPNLNFTNGGASFSAFAYTVNDGFSTSAPVFVTITITPVNDAPVAQNDVFTTAEDTPLVGANVATNDSDPDAPGPPGGGYVVVTAPPVGSFSAFALAANGALTFTPALNFTGSASFTYKIVDGGLDSNVATVTINVGPGGGTGDAPVAIDIFVNSAEDTPVNFLLAANDADTPITTFAITSFTLGSVGPIGPTTCTGTGPYSCTATVTWTPPANLVPGAVFTAFSYTAYDTTGLTDASPAVANVFIVGQNDPPIANNDNFTLPQGGSIPAGTVAANDSDPDSGGLGGATFIVVTPPTHAIGFVMPGAGGGAFGYTPDPTFAGIDTFTYKIQDAAGAQSGVATVTITVCAGTCGNDAPFAFPKLVNTAEDTPVVITLSATDADNNVINFFVSPATNGSLGAVSPIVCDTNSPRECTATVTFTPALNFNGTISPAFTYTAQDATFLISGPASVTVTVNAVDDPPVAVGDAFVVSQSGAFLGDVQPLDSDPDGPLSVPAIHRYEVVDQPDHASLFQFNSSGFGTSTFTYFPAAGYVGNDSFTYRIFDVAANAYSNTATVTIQVNNVNEPPVHVSKSVTTPEDTAITVTLEFTDVDGPTASFTPFTASGIGGTVGPPSPVTCNPVAPYSCTFTATFVPTLNFNGVASFAFSAVDSLGAFGPSGIISIDVTPVNDPPVAAPDGPYLVNENSSITVPAAGSVLNNDSDLHAGAPGENNTPLAAVLATGPQNASLFQLNADGTFTYTPKPNYNGPDSFTYKARDTLGGESGPVNVAINVAPVNTAPTANPDTYSTGEDVVLTISDPLLGVLANDTDVETPPPALFTVAAGAVIVTPMLPAQGTIVLNPNGTFTFTPALNFIGAATFEYKIDDGGVFSNVALVTINVGQTNDAPVNTVPAGPLATNEDTNLPIAGVSIADPDVGTNLLRVRLQISPAAAGTLQVNPVPGLNFACPAPNPCFGDGDDADMRFEGDAININTALATLTFKPAQHWNNNLGGPVTFTITTNDLGNTGTGGPLVDTDTVTINVTPINDAPVNTVPGGTINVPEDTTVPLPGFSVADVDVDETATPNNTLRVTITVLNGTVSFGDTTGLTMVGNGTASVQATGTLVILNTRLTTLSYTPNLHYVGPDTLTFASDDLGHTPAPAKTDSDNVPMQVGPINDAPVLTAPGAISTNEDTPLVFNGNISAADVDIGSSPMKVTMSVTIGTLTIGTTGLTFSTGDGNADANMVFTGTLANVNARLNGLRYNPPLNFNGTATLTITIDDQGATGLGGPKTDTKTVVITVIAVNDAPVNTVPASSPTSRIVVPRNGTKVVTGISIADIDANGSNVRVTLQSGNANLKVTVTGAPNPPGISLGLGQDGVDDGVIQMTGSIAAINQALSSITVKALNNYTGPAAVVVTTVDLGNTGIGGQKQDQDTIYFRVVP
jgi:hypothetical protein